jgi:hypothetical protein
VPHRPDPSGRHRERRAHPHRAGTTTASSRSKPARATGC